MEPSSIMKVMVVPIGRVPYKVLQDYHSMLLPLHSIPLSSITPFYTAHHKSPFPHQPWDSGSLRFNFVLDSPRFTPNHPFEDFQTHRKTFAVIGIVHCPSSSDDLNAVVDQFSTACNSYPSSLINRCFAFCPTDSQLEAGDKKGGNLRLFHDMDRQKLEFHLNMVMQEIAASLLMELEKSVLQAESSGTILRTMLDCYNATNLSLEELEKRRPGRVQKVIGDYCLLAGSPVDANVHYSNALELAKVTGDNFWYAGALEGSICALLASARSEYTDNSASTKKCKRKKTQAELGEEHRSLLKERKDLAEEIANMNTTFKALRARNESLKRMKLGLGSIPGDKRNSLADEQLCTLSKSDSKATVTELPDLNMLPSEDDSYKDVPR